jgi:malate dehydrogenase (oxaloacetate-decarboxylating)(NADP+)
MSRRPQFEDIDALNFHSQGKPGKLEIVPTKPMATQRDLSLAYSPGVAVPVKKIAESPDSAYDYTAKGNLVAVISNGTAILGLGDLGALASKPVMEGKAVLFKRFADIDSIDLEVGTKDVEEFIGAVRYLGPSFGGINLEDIKAPDCFIIEQRLRELMEIPVFHDDQHGTAIIATAALINALHITNRSLKDFRLVCNGAGAAAIACIELVKSLGVPARNVILCDSKGVVFKGRTEGMNQWKSAHAADTPSRTLAEAIAGADVFFGLSAAGALTPAMVKSMAPNPIIFAMANPDPEILPEEAIEIRPDAIIATGRSDYPNQVNNVLGFPYIFRGALDVRARTINDAMKVAAANALAALAREDVPDEVAAAYQGVRLAFGRDYLIPAPFDPRLISRIPAAVAKAAMESGVARKPIENFEAYSASLSARLDPIAGTLQTVFTQVRAKPKRIVFAEGEEDRMIRAANAYAAAGLGTAVLIGREDVIAESLAKAGLDLNENVTISNARISTHNVLYGNHLYERLQREGFLLRDCQRMANQDRNVFGACMVASGHADGMVTGLTRNFSAALEQIRNAVDVLPNRTAIGVSMALVRGRAVFIADTSIHELPSSEQLASIAVEAALVARRFGYDPRVAFLSYSTFGFPKGGRGAYVREAVELLRRRNVDFEFDGEMTADVALSREAMALYPFCRLTGPANVLIMPAAHSASISTKILQELGGATVIGPVLTGLSSSVQIATMSATSNDILNLAAIAAL